ncbi:hypothetical protein [Pyrococcus kukulkanii]|uniref:hypothetical protein n=1 Tax=Pyrococcus kukulkanii TaxID=1609559 RepID=UPI003FEE7CEA
MKFIQISQSFIFPKVKLSIGPGSRPLRGIVNRGFRPGLQGMKSFCFAEEMMTTPFADLLFDKYFEKF